MERRANVLLILADDLGYGDVACYNPESRVPTPNIDRLAAEGMSFTDAHSPATVCTPSRYSILTGRMEFRTGVPGVFTGAGGPCLIEESRLTLPGMLRGLGYRTALYGKWHVGLSFPDRAGQPINENGFEPVSRIDYTRAIPDAPIHRGFDHFYGTACCPTTDFLYAFIDGDRIPVPPTRLHDRAGLPDHPYARDNRIGWLAPGFDFEEIDLVFLERSIEFLERHAAASSASPASRKEPFFLMHSTQGVHLPSFPGKAFRGKTGAGPHGDFIFEFDYVVGELLAALERLGLADDTLVMVTSDNGPEVTSVVNMRRDYAHDGARPWRGMKRDQWEGGHRVPFVARWPGRIPAGSTSDQTVCLCDLMATCAAITGVDLPAGAAEDSYDILPAMLGAAPAGEAVRAHTLHQSFLGSAGAAGEPVLNLSIRRGRWKYLDHRGSGGNDYARAELKPYALPEKAPAAPGQLYDLEADPGETTNLYFKQPLVVAELKSVLDRYVDSGRSAPLRRPGGQR